jgi:mono/diheme cytochrome c family protein
VPLPVREVNMIDFQARHNCNLEPSTGRTPSSRVMVLLVILAFILLAPEMNGQARKSSAAPDTEKSGGDVARGKYLVEDVAMCGQCHTPRDSRGNLDRSRWLQGAAMPWTPADSSSSDWPLRAPRIGGNPPASDADMIKLLTTGIWTTGKPLRFPMMPFRMSASDAKAVVAYLKSLTPSN